MSARDAPRPVADDTVSHAQYEVETMDNAGLILFWIFIGLTAASLMCSIVVLCLRHCIMKFISRRSDSHGQADSSSWQTELHASTDQNGADRVKSKKEECGQADAVEAIEVRQPGGSVVVGVLMAHV